MAQAACSWSGLGTDGVRSTLFSHSEGVGSLFGDAEVVIVLWGTAGVVLRVGEWAAEEGVRG